MYEEICEKCSYWTKYFPRQSVQWSMANMAENILKNNGYSESTGTQRDVRVYDVKSYVMNKILIMISHL